MRRERGIGTLSVLALAMVLSLLLASAARLAVTAITSSYADQRQTEALLAADAGIAYAIHAVRSNMGWTTGHVLPASMPDERAWVLAQPVTRMDLKTGQVSYIRPRDQNGAPAGVIYAVGYSGQAVRVVKQRIKNGQIMRVAFLTDGDLVIGGDAGINGTSGDVHVNGALSISGNPTIIGDATSSGSFLVSGSPTIGGENGGGRPRMRLPDVNPEALRPLADYVMGADGKVRDQAGVVLADAGLEPYRGWTFSPGLWAVSGNVAYSGTYYAEGNVAVSGNLGEPAIPWVVTIIATGSVEISGNSYIQPKADGLAIVAGGDLKINGNPAQAYSGGLLAREQVMVSGNPTIAGYIVAQNAASTSTLVQGSSTISGTMTLSYNGDGYAPGGVTLRTWQELVEGRW